MQQDNAVIAQNILQILAVHSMIPYSFAMTLSIL